MTTEHAETISALRARAEGQRSHPQRTVEWLTGRIGRPMTIGILLTMIALWIAWNCVQVARGLTPLDPPPFFWLQGAVALYAALISTFVLATQNREKRHDEQRSYLELQINLRAEEKTAKIIALIEELRRDMPTVHNRIDKDANAMQLPVDTASILKSIEENLG